MQQKKRERREEGERRKKKKEKRGKEKKKERVFPSRWKRCERQRTVEGKQEGSSIIV